MGPVLRVSLDATAAVVLSALLMVPLGVAVVTVTGWRLPVEANPFATSETVRFRELEPGVAERIVAEARRLHPGDRIVLERGPAAEVTIHRLGAPGPVLGRLARRTEGAHPIGSVIGPQWMDSILPWLPEVPPDASPSEQAAALVEGLLRFLEESPSASGGGALGRLVRIVVPVLFSLTSLCFLLVGVLRLRGGRIRTPLRWRPAGRLAALGAAGGAACLAGSVVVERLFVLAGMPIPEQPVVEAVLSSRSGILLTAASLAVLAPVAEEVFFRGWVFRYLRQETGRRTAWTVSILLFAGLHLHPVGLALYALYGTVFCWLTERSGSILPSTVAHMLVNGTVVVLGVMPATASAGFAGPF